MAFGQNRDDEQVDAEFVTFDNRVQVLAEPRYSLAGAV
jgi:hypothetical protein